MNVKPEELKPLEETVAEATAALAQHCKDNPHEFIRNNRCAWCGIERNLERTKAP